MSIQEIREALSGFREKFGLSTFAELNIADLADLLVRLNELEKVIIHRIEVCLDERGEQTTPVFVEPGVTVKEVGLGVSVGPEGEGPKDYRKMLEEVGGWDNELASVPAGGVREVVEEVEALRVRVAQLDGNVDEARGVFRRIRDRVGAEEGEHILTAFERKFSELEKASCETTISPPVPPLCAECDGSGITHLDSRLRPCPKCNGRGRERPCPNCDGLGFLQA